MTTISKLRNYRNQDQTIKQVIFERLFCFIIIIIWLSVSLQQTRKRWCSSTIAGSRYSHFESTGPSCCVTAISKLRRRIIIIKTKLQSKWYPNASFFYYIQLSVSFQQTRKRCCPNDFKCPSDALAVLGELMPGCVAVFVDESVSDVGLIAVGFLGV